MSMAVEMGGGMLQDILAAAELTAPDGRLLHGYGLSDAQFSALGAQLQRFAPRHKRHAGVAGLYVLWAAERIRRGYDGSGLSWAFINADLPGIFDGTTSGGFVRLGLDHWRRPVRRGPGGTQQFMYTLLAEGGIPLAVLESARLHTKVLRDLIDEIGSRGGIAMLGHQTALDLAHSRMRLLPSILKHPDSVALFVDLAQAIFDLRESLPAGLAAGRGPDWLDLERPGWQRDLPLRLTPQIIENTIRPSLAAVHARPVARSLPATREIHLSVTETGALQAHPVAMLAAEACLPVLALPGAEVAVLRLVPRFASRRPLAYRALRQADSPNRDLDRLGASGPEAVPLDLSTALEFDVMADSQSLGIWPALSALPPAREEPTLWAARDGDSLRLRQLSGGRTRAASLWISLPADAQPDPGPGLAVRRRIEMAGESLVELQGQGLLRQGAHTIRIATGTDSEGEAATLCVFGGTLALWRTAGGDPVHLGRPILYGQKDEGALIPLSGAQLRRRTRPGSPYGAELCEWWSAEERLASARVICLPADLRIELQETATGGATVLVTGLPDGLLLDLAAGELSCHGRSGGGPLTLPSRRLDTAFVTLRLTEIASGRQLKLTAPWPSSQPQFILAGAVLPPRDLNLSFDELAGLSYLAPGSRCRMVIDLDREGAKGRSLEIAVQGHAPLLRHEPLLRRVLAQGTADNTVSVAVQNSAGATGRIQLRRYHGQMALTDDRLTLGLAADLAHGVTAAPEQRPGRASLHMLQVETGEVRALTADLTDAALDLRQATGIDSGLWLVQGRFDGFQQRPVAWNATPPDPDHPVPFRNRPQRIADYRRALQGQTRTAPLRELLRLILAARDGGDPAMLDQFHALASAPAVLARMLFLLSEEDLKALFSLDGQWPVFWPAFPVADLLAALRETMAAQTHALQSCGMPEAEEEVRKAMLNRLVFLRRHREELTGHLAILLFETGLFQHALQDARFEGLFLPQPRKAFDEALQIIARSDPALPRGLAPLKPRKLPLPQTQFQLSVQLVIGSVLATAEAARGLTSPLDDAARLNASLIETAIPDLFARALHPALSLDPTDRRS